MMFLLMSFRKIELTEALRIFVNWSINILTSKETFVN